MSGIKSVWGGASIDPDRHFKDAQAVREAFSVLKSFDINTIDTAQLYGESERILGEAKAGEEFIIDTKFPGGFGPHKSSKDIVPDAHDSIKKLGVKQVDIFYLHAPKPDESIAEILPAVNEVYKAGLFKRFGLSNFVAKDVQAVYDYCQEHDFIKPSVYQGNYSAVARRQETELLPILRNLGFSFYAYSPIAGGFLTKTKQEVLDGQGRFNKDDRVGQVYSNMYAKPEYLEALSQWESIAKEAGISRAELAYRWVKYNSALKHEHGDAIIVGSRNVEQLKETLEGLSAGPLSSTIVSKIDGVWETIKHVAPLDNFQDGFAAIQKK